MIALIDGDWLCARSYYALKDYRGADGQPAGAVYGFLNSLRTICRELVPYFLVICWGDHRKNLWRRKIYPAYKAERANTPPELIDQVGLLQDLMEALGLSQVLCPTFEADDCLSGITNDCVEAGREVNIVTGDHDLFQLIREERPVVRCYVPIKGEGYKTVRTAEVIEKFGIPPALLPMFMALKGEKGEAEGVPGIGKKRAKEYLLGQGSERTIAKIKSFKERVDLNLRLVDLRGIRSDDLTPSSLTVMPGEYDEMKVIARLRQVGLTGARSALHEVRSMMGFYQETQKRGAHSLDDILEETEDGR